MYVLSSLLSSRYSMRSTGSRWPASASSCKTLASVDAPVAVRFRRRKTEAIEEYFAKLTCSS